jgi:hypothetical protein
LDKSEKPVAMRSSLLILGVSLVLNLILISCQSPDKGASSMNDSPAEVAPVLYLDMKPPGMEPELFAPGWISTEFHDDGAPVFTPDGSEVYFRIAGKPQSLLFKMEFREGAWTSPVLDSMQSSFGFQFSVFSSNGQRRYFSTKWRPDGAEGSDSDMFYMEKGADGWSEPVSLKGPVHTDKDELLLHLTSNGDIYFAAEYPVDESTYPTGEGNMDLYVSRLKDGEYLYPENLSGINTEYVETGCALPPDESYMVFTSTRLPASSGINLWISFRETDKSWGPPINLGSKINDIYTDKFPGISPDGKYLFWVSHREHENQNPPKQWSIDGITMPEVPFEGGDIYWISTDFLLQFR